MKFKKNLSKALACAVVLALLAPAVCTPVPAYASECSDTSDHWAEKYIKSAISKGIANGYSNGTFKPNKAVTRAEFAAMLNKALGNTSTATISFNDVSSSDWYYLDISKAVAANYVSGYSDSSFKPNNPITREEAAVIISHIVPSYGSSGNLKEFGDYSSISDWALTAIQKSNAKGYIGAYDDEKIHSKDCLTRAQTVKIICDITDKETIISSAPEVKISDTTLSGKIYSNGVTIHKDLGEGNATIDNCIVMGELSIQGGGSNSVVINNSRIADCSVAKGNSSVRVVTKGETSILNTDVSYKAKLETSNLTGGDTGIGFCKVKANGTSDISLVGSFPKIEVSGANSDVKLESGNVTTLDVGSSARNSKITVENNGTILSTNVNSSVSFRGDGTVQKMNANADGITYEKKPAEMNIGSGVTTKPTEIRDVTFDPFDGEKNVPTNKKITITFSQAMTKYDGKEILNSAINNLIKLTKESKSGSTVPFSASINSAKKVITITPDQNLTTDVKYCITIDKDVFKNEGGNGNAAQLISFTVGAGTVNNVTFSPANGATGIKTSSEPTITFNSAIKAYSGDAITAKYLKNNIIFRKDSASGADVNFTASINNNSNIITIVLDDKMISGQKYYLGFDSKVFVTNSNNLISGQNVTWTAGTTTTPTISFNIANGTAGVSAATNISATFSERIFNASGSVPNSSDLSGTIKMRDNTEGSYVPYNITFSDSSNSVISINPTKDLTAGHNYTLTVAGYYFQNAEGKCPLSSSISFTVLGNIDVTVINTAITRANSAMANVVQSENGKDVSNIVYWVTSSQMNALNSAIATATKAMATVQTATAASSAASSLDSATKVFEQSKKLGLNIKVDPIVVEPKVDDPKVDDPKVIYPKVVDTTEIDHAIAFANLVKKGVVISEDGTDVLTSKQWVTPALMSALNEAISKATKAKTTVKTDEEAMEAALEQSWAAAKYFDAEKKYGTKGSINNSNLASAINTARSLSNATERSTDGQDIPTDKYWVPEKKLEDFVYDDIYKAQKVLLNSSATQAEIDNAESAISAASESFSKIRQLGTKAN